MSPEQTPLTDEQIRVQAIVDALTHQRNQALNALVQIEAQMAVMANKIKALEAKPEEPACPTSPSP